MKATKFLPAIMQAYASWDGDLVGHVVGIAGLENCLCVCIEFVCASRLYDLQQGVQSAAITKIVQAPAEALSEKGAWVSNTLERTDRVALVRNIKNSSSLVILTGYTKKYLTRRYKLGMDAFPYDTSLASVFDCILKAHHFLLMKCACDNDECTVQNTLSCDPHNRWAYHLM